MKRAYAGVALTLTLSATYLALREPSVPPAASSTVVAASTTVPSPAQPRPAQEPPAIATSTQEPTSSSAEGSMLRYRRPQQATPVGSVRVTRSADYIRSFEILRLGSSVKENDYSTVAATVKAKYGVTDEELVSLLDYSVKAVEADRAYEIVQTRKMCDRRGEFQSLYDLGMALNDLTENIESNLERLSRDAEAVLGPMIVVKINTFLLSSQRQYNDAFTTDWPALLAARNTDLSTELEQACGWLDRREANEARN